VKYNTNTVKTNRRT